MITSCAEHQAVLRPLLYLRERRRLHLTIIGLDAQGGLDRQAFSDALVRGTGLVVLGHASHVTGRLFDVAPLFVQARAMGAHTLLDASQTIGQVPVHPEELAADVVVFSGHKRLRGPSGTGGLCISNHAWRFRRNSRRPRVPAVRLSRNHRMNCRWDWKPAAPAVSAFAGLCAALRWYESDGRASAAEAHRLEGVLRRKLRQVPGVELIGDSPRAPHVPIVSLVIRGKSVTEVRDALAMRFGIRSSAGLLEAPLLHRAWGRRREGAVRFGLSGFNTQEQVNRLLQAVGQLAKER